MNVAFYSGVSGMAAFQTKMDLLSHNIANVNTTAYKPSEMAFNDILYTEMDINNKTPELMGHGVKPVATDLTMEQGTPQGTQRPLDICIMGDGFFCIERPDGLEYTRNGDFSISIEGERGYLVTRDGGYVLDSGGKRIPLARKEDPETGDAMQQFDEEEVINRVGVYQFSNPYGLETADGSSFIETPLSGPASSVTRKRLGGEFELKNRFLESSAVDLGESMVDVIMAQRSFQFNARVVQTADQLEEIVNTLR